MPFPLSFSSQIELPESAVHLSDTDVISSLSIAVADHAANIRAVDNGLDFDVPMTWMISKRDILAYVDCGTFRVEHGHVTRFLTFTISFRRGVIIATVLVLGVFGLLALAFSTPVVAICGLLGIWLLLVGPPYWLTRFRFPGFLRQALTRRAGGA